MSTHLQVDPADGAAVAAALAAVREAAAAMGDGEIAGRGVGGPPPGVVAMAQVERGPVQILRWPAEADRRDPARPCLWLLAVGELAPPTGPGEDWLRLPVDERDLAARVARLADRAPSGSSRPSRDPIEVGADGRVERCGTIVHLSPIEAALLSTLARRMDRVVAKDEVRRAVWGDEPPTDRALDSRIHALRLRIAPLGLAVHTVRGRGLLLTVVPASDGASPAVGYDR